jgi:hypothetical protein
MTAICDHELWVAVLEIFTNDVLVDSLKHGVFCPTCNRMYDEREVAKVSGVRRVEKKMDGRKHNSAKTCAKKAAAGKANKTSGVFTPKNKSVRDPDLQSRIEKVVKMAKTHNASGDPFLVRHTIFWNSRVTGCKLG